jgi:putative membrane protein
MTRWSSSTVDQDWVITPESSSPLKRSRPVIEPIEPEAFIASAMMECMTDLQVAQLALAQGTTDSVRNFALHLIEDCNRILLDVARIATRKNLSPPRSLDPEHENIVRRMREKTGTDFDTAYMERIAMHHRLAITLFKRGQTIKNPEVSALASRVLAMTEARIKLSRQLPASIDHLLDGGGLPHPQVAADNVKAAAAARPADGEF